MFSRLEGWNSLGALCNIVIIYSYISRES